MCSTTFELGRGDLAVATEALLCKEVVADGLHDAHWVCLLRKLSTHTSCQLRYLSPAGLQFLHAAPLQYVVDSSNLLCMWRLHTALHLV